MKRYASPPAFKQALEQRIKAAAVTSAEIDRARQLLVFDRFLARVVVEFGAAMVLKGGVALELRLERARTTKDIDLRMVGSPRDLGDRLVAAANIDFDDYLRFEVRADPQHPVIHGDGMRYEGARFQVQCRLAEKIYGRPFGVDVGFGDIVVGEPEIVVAEDRLGFAGVAPPVLRVYPLGSHIAEKFHAYTLPRARPNSRVKDLPDLALLATVCELDLAALRTALTRTFEFRATHPLLSSVPRPPEHWRAPYRAMAEEDGLTWRTLDEVYDAVSDFLDPVLVADQRGAWSSARWRWD